MKPKTKSLALAERHAHRQHDNDRRALMIVLGEMWHALSRSTVRKECRRLSIHLDDEAIVTTEIAWIENGLYNSSVFTFARAEVERMTPQELLRGLAEMQ